MKKYFIIFLFFPLSIFCQVKPASPSLQSGWSTNCVRAIILNEGSGTDVADLSGTATCTLNLASWGSDSEGPYFDAAGAEYISLNTGLPGASIGAYSWYMRMRITGTGALQGLAATLTGSPFFLDDLRWQDDVTDNRLIYYVKNGSGTCATCNPSGDTYTADVKFNVIGIYDGDSVKVYVDGVRRCAAALTGNLQNSGYTTRIGFSNNGAFGCISNDANFQSFRIYTVCIWTRALNSTEIAQIELAPYVMFGESLNNNNSQFKNSEFKNSEFKNKRFKNNGFKR